MILVVDFGDNYIDRRISKGDSFDWDKDTLFFYCAITSRMFASFVWQTKIHCSSYCAITSNSFTGEMEEEELIEFRKIYDKGVSRGYNRDCP